MPGVPASGYYVCQQVHEQTGSDKLSTWEEVLAKIFGVHKRCYGTRCLQVSLLGKGYHVGR